ncbi:hypothetical protein FD755_002345 [Muntiacus reevesi]|uniref:Carbohydrate kinase FGGY C-terminal domain-containing protein n=1 Tax=Muntiacus reevesi TaxID=9886 RepID=A0A5J5N716_MUNRE|nr:hypothetical protein FD755_002345 [Muntiacus reevesi]
MGMRFVFLYFKAMVPGATKRHSWIWSFASRPFHLPPGHVSCPCVYAYLNSHLDLIKKAQPVGFLTVDLHVWPDFHGNRSPLADLTLKGMFGTRLIIEAMESSGHSISTLFLCGGLSKNPLFVQMHADITGMPVVLSQEVESVLVGAAILGACASGDFASVQILSCKIIRLTIGLQKVRETVWIRAQNRAFESFSDLLEIQFSHIQLF